jgi:Tfp pilus assembly protein PilO
MYSRLLFVWLGKTLSLFPLNTMSSSQKRNIVFTVAIVGVWFFFVFWKPIQHKNVQLDEELARKKAEEQVYQAQIKQIEATMKASSDLYREYTHALRDLGDQQKLVSGVQEEITKQAQAAKLNIASIETLPEVKTGDIFVGKVKVSATGTYAQILKFVSAITNSDRLINFDEFAFTKFSGGSKEEKNRILKFDFTLEFYRVK